MDHQHDPIAATQPTAGLGPRGKVSATALGGDREGSPASGPSAASELTGPSPSRELSASASHCAGAARERGVTC